MPADSNHNRHTSETENDADQEASNSGVNVAQNAKEALAKLKLTESGMKRAKGDEFIERMLRVEQELLPVEQAMVISMQTQPQAIEWMRYTNKRDAEQRAKQAEKEAADRKVMLETIKRLEQQVNANANQQNGQNVK